MAGTVGDRVGAARRRAFVGRDTELACFRRLVGDPHAETAVLFIHGPGGVGKSTLLRPAAAVDGLGHRPGVVRPPPDPAGGQPDPHRERRLPAPSQCAPEQRAAAVAFTRGHLLALALVSEVVLTRGSFAPQQAPDVVKALVDQRMQAIPSAEHRLALEATVQVRVLTLPLLAALLDRPDAAVLSDWLCRLPVVELSRGGLRLHDLAADVLDAELRWRDPLRYRHLHDRARAYFLDRLGAADPAEAAAAMMVLTFLHRELRPYLQPAAAASHDLRLDAATSADAPAILEIINRHEGAESAAIAKVWLTASPQAWSVVRASDGTVAGLLCTLAIEDHAALADVPDPAVAAAYTELANHAPLRQGERFTLIRYWMGADGYQGISPAQSLVTMQSGRHYLTTPGLAFSLVSVADPQAWAAASEYSDLHRMPAADFTVGGRRYASFGHDWRVVTPTDWLARLAMRETGAGEPPPVTDAAAVLAREDFAAAVRRALRGLTRADRLRTSPLLTSRLVSTRVPADARTAERVEALREVLVGACRSIQSDPRAYRVLHRSFLAPAPSLEAAAEALGMPSSTFRRHLTSAVDRVVEVLWEQELGL